VQTDPVTPEVRKGQGSTHLSKEEFTRRLQERFYDPLFAPLAGEIHKIAEAAWLVYDQYHKSPRTQPAGPGFADPSFELPVEWLRRGKISRRRSVSSATRAHLLECSSSVRPRAPTRPVRVRCPRPFAW
jgi:hypothetical protein